MAETKKTGTATKKGSFLEEAAGIGLENIAQDDVQIPKLKLLQSMSPELDESKPAYNEKAKNGVFYLTIPGVPLGKKIEVIPLHQVTFWVEYLPGRGGFVGRHTPNSIPVDKTDFSNWYRKDTGNEIVESREWVVLVIGHEEVGPVLMSFTSSAIKASKAWMSLVSIERTPGGNPAPIFANVWELSSVSQSNDKGSWSVVSSAPRKVRMITEKEYKSIVSPARDAAVAILAPPPVSAGPAIEHKSSGEKKKIAY